jgi:iron complex outermembrane receptor protein
MFKKVFCLLMLCAAASGFAEEIETVEGGTVTITTNRPVRNLLATPSAESASLEIATSTVTGEDIRLQNAATWSDALKFAPGVFTETRGRKNKSFTSFRGQIYPYPDFAMNGIWQREFRDMAYTLPASQIGRIEVVRSSGTLLMGLADIVGVINVLPEKYDKPTTMIEGEIGTFNSWRTGIAHGNTTSNGWYTAGATANATDGPGGRNAAERSQSVYGYGGIQAHERLYLEGQFFAMQGSRELMTPEPDGPAQNSLKNQVEEYDPFNAYSLGGKAVFEQSPSASLELSAYYTERSYHYERTVINTNQPPRTNQKYIERDYEYGAQLIQALELTDANTLRFGGVYNHWVCPNGKDFYVGSPQDVETVAAVLTDEQRLGKLTLDAGLRVMRDYYNEYSGGAYDINGVSRDFATIRNEWGDPLLTGTLGTKYQVTDAVSLYSHLAGGQRSADPGALKQDGTDLENETRVMVDAGVQVEDTDKGTIKLGGFYVLRNDAVTKVGSQVTNAVTGDTFYFSDNQDVRQYGLELETRSAPIGGIATLFFSATFMESELKPAGGSGYEEYREIPNWILSGGMYVQHGPFDFNLFGKHVSAYENYRFAQPVGGVAPYCPLGDFFDLNLTAGYTFGAKRSTRVYVSVQNLLDDEYSTVVGWDDPGTKCAVGVQHTF